MLQFIAHTGRSTRIIAAVLIQLLSKDTNSVIVDLDTLPMDDQEYYKGHRVIFIGDHPPIKKMDVFNKAEELVYIGNVTYRASGKENPLYKTHSNVKIIPTAAATAISSVLDYIKENNPEAETYDRPILHYLCHKSDCAKSIHHIALTLSAKKLSIADVHMLLDYSEAQVEQLRVAGMFLDIRHNDLITRFLEKETRDVVINGLTIKCCGSNNVHTSYMATELANKYNIGLSYYDTAEFRHFELRASKDYVANTPGLKKTLYQIKDANSGLGTIFSMRFRVPRDQPLSSL